MTVDRPIKVVHVITTLDVGGAEVMLLKLLASMDRARVSSSVICLAAPGPVQERIAALGVPVSSADMRPSSNPIGGWFLLRRLLRAAQPDIVQTWLFHADLMGTIAAASLRVPCVWNLRCAELAPQDYSPGLRAIVRLLARLSRWPRAVVVNSAEARRAAERRGYAPRRWIELPNGFDTARFRPRPEARLRVRAALRLAPDTPIVGLVARWHTMKDHATFLAAAARVRASCPTAQFVLVGRGLVSGNSTLAAMLDAHPELRGSAHLMGEVADTAEVTAALDVAVCSSYSESFPNAIGEAMACGVPCVSTDAGDCAVIIGDTGRIVPPRNPAALADGIETVLRMASGERAALGAAARTRIEAEYSLAAVAHRYEQIYEDIACVV